MVTASVLTVVVIVNNIKVTPALVKIRAVAIVIPIIGNIISYCAIGMICFLFGMVA